jgi:hypothetical protein
LRFRAGQSIVSGVYLWIRVLHVLLGAIWVGFIVFTVLFLTPAMRDLGPDSAKLMASLRARGLIVFMPVVAGITIASGIYLYWRYTAGFSPEVSRTPSGMAFGIGGACGILAYIIGMAVVSVNMARAAKLAHALPSTPEPQRAALMATINTHRQRAARASQIVAVLVVAAIMFMAAAPRL